MDERVVRLTWQPKDLSGPDGTVLVLAEPPPALLQQLEPRRAVWHDPSLGKDIAEADLAHVFDFRLRHRGSAYSPQSIEAGQDGGPPQIETKHFSGRGDDPTVPVLDLSWTIPAGSRAQNISGGKNHGVLWCTLGTSDERPVEVNGTHATRVEGHLLMNKAKAKEIYKEKKEQRKISQKKEVSVKLEECKGDEKTKEDKIDGKKEVKFMKENGRDGIIKEGDGIEKKKVMRYWILPLM